MTDTAIHVERPKTMKAVITSSHGGLEVLKLVRDHPVPSAGPNEVLLKIAACAVNPHDIFTRRGMPGINIPLPMITGSDVAGTIVDVGAGVEYRAVGDHVLLDPVDFSSGKPKMYGETMPGGRAEYMVANASQLIDLPCSVSLEDAAALPLAYGTAYRMLMTRGRLSSSDRVLILGASGGVGVACIQIAKAVGAEVIACASKNEKLQRLKDLGADHLVNYSEEPFREAVRRIYGKPRVSGGGGVTIAVNFSGGDTLPDTQKSVARHGRILCCGATAGFDMKMDARYWWSYEHDMIGSDGWTRKDLVTLLDWISTGRLSPLIDSKVNLADAADAEKKLEEREVVGKILLVP